MKTLVPAVLFFSWMMLATEPPPKEGSARVGHGFAVLEFSKEDGFKLSSDSQKTLGIQFEALAGKGPWLIPHDALIMIKHSTGVYRRFNDWTTLVLVTIINRKGDSVLVSSDDLEPGDQIAVKGAPFLRMTEADLNSDTVDACAH